MTHHPSAIIDPKATIGANVSIGPFCTIGPDVTIGDDVEIVSHVVIDGRTTIGKGCRIFPFACIGTAPQDLKYHGELSKTIIGENTTIREYVTIQPGTEGGTMETVVGSNCLLMVGVHVAHDCNVGDHVIMANNATLAGHVCVGDYAVIGGLAAVHQFVRIGHHAMVGGLSGIESDIIPFGQAMGKRANLCGLNLVGLKRQRFSRDDIHTLRSAYRMLFAAEGTLAERLEDVQGHFEKSPAIDDILAFIMQDSSRGLCQPE